MSHLDLVVFDFFLSLPHMKLSEFLKRRFQITLFLISSQCRISYTLNTNRLKLFVCLISKVFYSRVIIRFKSSDVEMGLRDEDDLGGKESRMFSNHQFNLLTFLPFSDFKLINQTDLA